MLYRRQRWLTPDGSTIVAELPGGVSGHFGSGLIRFALSQYHKCRVTLALITGQLHDFGLSISERQVLRFLIKGKEVFLAEASDVLRAGLETAGWITVDPRLRGGRLRRPPSGPQRLLHAYVNRHAKLTHLGG